MPDRLTATGAAWQKSPLDASRHRQGLSAQGLSSAGTSALIMDLHWRRLFTVLLTWQLAALILYPDAAAGSRIIVLPLSSSSRLHDLVKLSMELTRRGHEVMLVTPAAVTQQVRTIVSTAKPPKGACVRSDGLATDMPPVGRHCW